jgi:hypothetical protein
VTKSISRLVGELVPPLGSNLFDCLAILAVSLEDCDAHISHMKLVLPRSRHWKQVIMKSVSYVEHFEMC